MHPSTLDYDRAKIGEKEIRKEKHRKLLVDVEIGYQKAGNKRDRGWKVEFELSPGGES